MSRILLCLCMTVVFFSCADKEGKGTVLSTAKMQDVMWDMLMADAYTEKYLKTDSSKKELKQNAALQQKIFEFHKINREDFYKSYNYYSSRPDVMRIMLDTIGAKAERERSGLMMERYSGGGIKPPPSVTDSARRAHEER
ncbi:MAG: DUF4296 domain-containing protein [Chitinophagaceae bacterium]|nr:DUF4296 domain-containing protein [Chitinophagaceae bacterium]